MSNSGDLLRMLMPAVTPVPTSNAPRPDSSQPIESRSFDSLLAEAQQAESTEAADAIEQTQQNESTTQTQPTNPLPGLTGISSIHNASLRQIIAGDSQT